MQRLQHLMESGTDPNSPLNAICVSKRSAVLRYALSRSLSVPEDFTRVFSLGERDLCLYIQYSG